MKEFQKSNQYIGDLLSPETRLTISKMKDVINEMQNISVPMGFIKPVYIAQTNHQPAQEPVKATLSKSNGLATLGGRE